MPGQKLGESSARCPHRLRWQHGSRRNHSSVFEQKARLAGLCLLGELLQQLTQQARTLRAVLQLAVSQGQHEPVLRQLIARHIQPNLLQQTFGIGQQSIAQAGGDQRHAGRWRVVGPGLAQFGSHRQLVARLFGVMGVQLQ